MDKKITVKQSEKENADRVKEEEESDDRLESETKKRVSSIIMASVGSLEPFDLTTPSKWVAYKERFELYLLANDIEDESRKKAAFLTLAGAPLYELLTSLASPRQISESKLSEIYHVLTAHLSPRPSEIAAFYHFHNRDQHSDESVGAYMAALRSLAVDCIFGSALDRMLRDRFVCGMRDEGLQRTVQRVLERAVTSEATAISALSMRKQSDSHSDPNAESIHGIRTSRNLKPRTSVVPEGPCAGCGGQHIRKKCPFRNATCHGCGRTGHIQKVCRSAPQTRSSSYGSPTPSSRSNRNGTSRVNQILPLVSQKKSVSIAINGRTCVFEVGSGSPVTIMKESTFRYIWPNEKPDLMSFRT
nr:uncharacterized protein LOC123002809 [Drosophila takahashii]